MAHTPGPWNYSELMPDGFIIKKSGTFEINTPDYDVCTLVPFGAPIRNEDDARLIAAAPELLEACGAILEWAQKEKTSYTELRQVMDLTRAAIAKAEGK